MTIACGDEQPPSGDCDFDDSGYVDEGTACTSTCLDHGSDGIAPWCCTDGGTLDDCDWGYCDTSGRYGDACSNKCVDVGYERCRGCYERSKCGITAQDMDQAVSKIGSECDGVLRSICATRALCFSPGCGADGGFLSMGGACDHTIVSAAQNNGRAVTMDDCKTCFPNSGCGLDPDTYPPVQSSAACALLCHAALSYCRVHAQPQPAPCEATTRTTLLPSASPHGMTRGVLCVPRRTLHRRPTPRRGRTCARRR